MEAFIVQLHPMIGRPRRVIEFHLAQIREHFCMKLGPKNTTVAKISRFFKPPYNLNNSNKPYQLAILRNFISKFKMNPKLEHRPSCSTCATLRPHKI
jgi:hypothetical protein